MIILKKKPSHFSKVGKISSGYFNTTSSSKTSLLLHPYHTDLIQKPPAGVHHGVEPLIVVDTVTDTDSVMHVSAADRRRTAYGYDLVNRKNYHHNHNDSPASHSRSFSEPHIIANYARLFHKSVPTYTYANTPPNKLHIHTPNPAG